MKKILNISINVIFMITTVILGMFIFRSSYLRLWETMRDFGLSVAYYFSLIFKASGYLPVTAEEFKRQIVKFFTTFISKDNFISWLVSLNNIAVKVSKSVVLLFPCLIVCGL